MFPKPERLWPDTATILERSRGVFFAQWEELLRLRRVVIKTSSPEDIHDLRIASRRFRAALELFYPFVAKCHKNELRRKVQKLTRVLGGQRNIDEALLFFQAPSRADHSADSVLIKTLSSMRPLELKRIKNMLTSFDHRNLDKMARKMVAGVNETSIAERSSITLLSYFSDVSIRQYMSIHQLLAGATRPENFSSRHALRIAIKKWRYFFEIIAKILDRDYSIFLEQLKEYQSVLGRMNDIIEFETLLRNMNLPKGELERAKAALKTEETLLLDSFVELVERKPLTYTFLI
ncbi:MAG: CHAD domain-containing protein [Desulfuromonadaceae bacterium]|nr:CHAD domain-containing protein [Desulfuromonadaceae bacterium]MDD5104503.1 CHAD domain-containing protein [Desulfuromonadaceae bacterium]